MDCRPLNGFKSKVHSHRKAMWILLTFFGCAHEMVNMLFVNQMVDLRGGLLALHVHVYILNVAVQCCLFTGTWGSLSFWYRSVPSRTRRASLDIICSTYLPFLWPFIRPSFPQCGLSWQNQESYWLFVNNLNWLPNPSFTDFFLLLLFTSFRCEIAKVSLECS